VTWGEAPERPHWSGMVPPDPQVRYFDARGRRRWIAPVLMVVLLLAAAGVTGALLLRSDDAAVDSAQAPTGDLPAGDPAAVASSPDSVVPDDTEASSVAMIGDSITQGSEDALRFTFTVAGLDTIDIDGLTSRRIQLGGGKGQPESGMQALERMLDAGIDPDVWVIALGTNDVGQYSDPEEYRRLVREVLDALPDDTPLVWVDVYRADHLDDTDVFNRILRDELDERGDATVVSWFDQASTRGDEILRKDGVHPNKQGNALFAGIVTQGVAQVT